MRIAGWIVTAIALSPLAAEAGSITGQVRFAGEPPARPTVTMAGDPACDKLEPGGHAAEVVVVAPDGALANTIVYVRDGLSDKYKAPAAAAPVLIDQTRCSYVPHVVGVQVGQEIEIRNSDPTMHNVHARAAVNPPFNDAMPGAGQVLRKSFSKPELAVKLKCDIHPWMAAYVGVFSHPYFAVSAADGSYTIKGVPEGEYLVEAWHESLGTRAGKIEVDDDDSTAFIDFQFAGN